MIDQLTKFYAANKQAVIIKNFLSISYITNTGAGFGVFKGYNSLIIFLTIIFMGLIVYYYDRIPENKLAVVFSGLLLGGALGNLIDRIFFGFVRDFINFSFWPAFNIADAAITVGGIGLLIYLMKKK